MEIQFQYNSVQIDSQENLPALISMANSYLPKKKAPKRRRRKMKETVGPLIQDIIDSINK